MASGEFRTLQDVCVLNYKSMLGPVPSVWLYLEDWSQVELPLDSIKELRLAGLTQVPLSPGANGAYAGFHITLNKPNNGFSGHGSEGRD